MSKRIFSSFNKEKILNKCPLCGGELEYVALHQYSDVYRILKNGKISKNNGIETVVETMLDLADVCEALMNL